MSLLRRTLVSWSVLLGSCAPALAFGAELPTTTVLVAAGPGGPVDALARALADALTASGTTIAVVENRAGASGTIAAGLAVRSSRPSATVLVAGMGPTVAAPLLQPQLSYKPDRELAPVAMLASGMAVLVVPRDLPVDSVGGLVAMARNAAQPALAYGSGGPGSSNHLCAEQFRDAIGAPMLHVPFQGDAQALASLVSGDVQLMFMAPNVALPQVASGRLRALAVSGNHRMAQLPDVPTLREAGLKDFDCRPWTMAFVPSSASAEARERVQKAWSSAVAQPATRERIEAMGFELDDRAGLDPRAVLRDTAVRLQRAFPPPAR